jgi:hypothetical protein
MTIEELHTKLEEALAEQISQRQCLELLHQDLTKLLNRSYSGSGQNRVLGTINFTLTPKD